MRATVLQQLGFEELVAGSEFETWGVGFDQQFDTGTYLGVTAELLTSDGARHGGREVGHGERRVAVHDQGGGDGLDEHGAGLEVAMEGAGHL